MSFTLNDEQQELRNVVRDFLADHSSEAEVRRLMGSEAGYDPQVWQRLAGELGLVGLVIPEEFGGGGFGWVELGVVLEETGRALLCAPFLSTVALAVPVLISGDPEVAKEYLPAIVAGETIATLALTEETGSWDPKDVTTRAERDGDGWRISGHKTFVPDGALADLVLTVARTPDGIGLFAVEAAAPGVGRRRLPTMDQTRPQAAIDLDGVGARPVLLEGPGTPVLRQALHRAAIAIAAEQVGGADKALDLAVEYAKVRTQFGRPIGSFQAIKHMCAEMLLQVESARSAALHRPARRGRGVAGAGRHGQPGAGLLHRRVPRRRRGAASRSTAASGVTWEHPAHLYFKRATSSAQFLLGDADRHRELFAAGAARVTAARWRRPSRGSPSRRAARAGRPGGRFVRERIRPAEDAAAARRAGAARTRRWPRCATEARHETRAVVLRHPGAVRRRGPVGLRDRRRARAGGQAQVLLPARGRRRLRPSAAGRAVPRHRGADRPLRAPGGRERLADVHRDRRAVSGGTDPKRAIRTTAVRKGDSYVLNGRKQWITNGERARFGIVYARTEGGITAFVVDGDAEGPVDARPIPVLRNHWPIEMVLDDVVVPVENRIGEEGAGLTLAADWLVRQRLSYAARAVGHRRGGRAARRRVAAAAARPSGRRWRPGRPRSSTWRRPGWRSTPGRWLTWDAAWIDDAGGDARNARRRWPSCTAPRWPSPSSTG